MDKEGLIDWLKERAYRASEDVDIMIAQGDHTWANFHAGRQTLAESIIDKIASGDFG